MPDLLAEFDAVLSPLVSDPRFRAWGGLVLTSCLLGGRRVWTSIRGGQPLYPHLFVALVANSGFGKSTTIGAVRDALDEWEGIKVGAEQISIARMVRELGHIFPNPHNVKGMSKLRDDCYAFLPDELGAVFGDKAHTGDLQMLANIWDMKARLKKQNVYSEQKNAETAAYDHYMVMFAGGQPAWLAEAMPLGKFQMGFPARTHFVLGTVRTAPQFTQDRDDWLAGLKAVLHPTMRAVNKIRGKIGWESDAWGAFKDWGVEALENIDAWGSLLEGYGSRRPEHAAKLALIVACARVAPSIRLADWEHALAVMLDTERVLPDVLANIGANTARAREDDIVAWVRQRGETREEAIRAHMRHFINARDMDVTLEQLVKAGQLKCTTPDQVSPRRKFKA